MSYNNKNNNIPQTEQALAKELFACSVASAVEQGLKLKDILGMNYYLTAHNLPNGQMYPCLPFPDNSPLCQVLTKTAEEVAKNNNFAYIHLLENGRWMIFPVSKRDYAKAFCKASQ